MLSIFEMSETTKKKAKHIVDTHGLQKLDDSTWLVRSSTSPESTSYMVSNYTCECKGYRYRRTCSHIEAVRMYENEGGCDDEC